MKPTIKNILLIAGISSISGLAFIHCGSDSTSPPPTTAQNPGAANTDLGNFNLSCNGQQTSGQQKQVPFQQQQQSGCKQQKFQYQQQKTVDYDVNLDCNAKQVIVKNNGVDQQQQTLPIQSDGSVKGKVQYQQQIQNDGKGNQVCWIQYEVAFDGKAQCGGVPTPSSTPIPIPSALPSTVPSIVPSSSPIPSPLPSASASDIPGEKGKLSLITTVNFLPTNSDALRQLGVDGASPTPAPTATPSVLPSTSPTPSATPSSAPSATPSASPSPTPSPSPSITPTPSGTPVVICVVDDPCPVVGTTDLSCGQ